VIFQAPTTPSCTGRKSSSQLGGHVWMCGGLRVRSIRCWQPTAGGLSHRRLHWTCERLVPSTTLVRVPAFLPASALGI
jgi:hypothetical protein